MKPLSALFLKSLIFLFLASITGHDLFSQPDIYADYYYRIYIRDKGGGNQEPVAVYELLSDRAIERRNRNGISSDSFDTPIHQPYIDSLRSMGLRVHCRSKWLNTVTVASPTIIDNQIVENISFIDSILLVRPPLSTKGFTESAKPEIEEGLTVAPPYYWQIQLSRGDFLHDMGMRGNNKLIAVLDGGYTYADIIESLTTLHNEGRIGYTYDFILGNEHVYNYSSHGTAILSILAGDLPGSLTGSAPGASYLLLRTEDGFSEYPIEEDLWVAAAEFADSAGADIITSSLGYSLFDDPAMNYTWSQLDGKSTFVSIGAGIAFSRGIIVVNSAGNARDDPWLYVTSPADSEGVISAGAVDAYGKISKFSSAGPTYDGRVKPDIVALGVDVSYQTQPGSIRTGNGTSFACPIISGLTACLMQSFPDADIHDIKKALMVGADKYLNPDTLYGYGLANFHNAFVFLNEQMITDEHIITFYPNPSGESLQFRTNESIDRLHIRIFSVNGTLLYESDLFNISDPVTRIRGFENLAAGIYIIRASTGQKSWQEKIIKLK